MKKKKRIIAISMISLVALLSFGCGTNTDNTTKSNGTRDNVGDGYLSNMDNQYNNRTNDGIVDDNNRTENDLRSDGLKNNSTINKGAQDINRTWNAALGDSELVDRIQEICNRKEKVDDTSVVINDDTCYVGLDVKGGKLDEKTKEELSTEIKREEPSITKVYFTEDRDKVQGFIDDIGDTAQVSWNKLENMFR